ncbi:hypothetical protein [Poseidonibacter sp.]|uniref:hypothetical protein n=1 Tax=Poseidonibacter sp. TaxID=2321188 RepID=UPI003C77F157
MFSFIKFLQGFLQKIKRNKGLWFTTLAVLSIFGIGLSLYILISMTKNVSKEVYVNISQTYTKSLKNRLVSEEETLKKILLTVKNDNTLINDISTNNLENVNTKIQSYNENFKKSNFGELTIGFYPVINQVNQYRNSVNSVIERKVLNFGIEVLADGIFILLLEPILEGDNLIGVLEIKEPLYSLKDDFLKDDSIFLFLLEQKMLNKLSIEARKDKYREIIDELNVEEERYNGAFFGKIVEGGREGYKELIDNGYYVDNQFFKTYKKVSDINGNVIGIVVLGEVVEGSGAFVNIVDNMTKTVTTVALGLVISILLFMF